MRTDEDESAGMFEVEEEKPADLPQRVYVGESGEDGDRFLLAFRLPEEVAENAEDGEEFVLGEYKLVGKVRVTARLEITVKKTEGVGQ